MKKYTKTDTGNWAIAEKNNIVHLILKVSDGPVRSYILYLIFSDSPFLSSSRLIYAMGRL